MVALPDKYIIFHGAIVLMGGLLTGFPLRQAIIRANPESTRAWRVAHSVLVMDGLMMLMIGLAVPRLALGKLAISVLVWALVISGYGFVTAFTIGAWKGCRGLAPRPYGLNTVLYGAHILGASGSVLGMAMIIYGFYRALN